MKKPVKIVLYLMYAVVFVILFSASNTSETLISKYRADNSLNGFLLKDSIIDVKDTINAGNIENMFKYYYVVQAAAGNNYINLQKVCEEAAVLLNTKVDYEGRIYDPEKGIILSDTSTLDLIYAGDYYPRRPMMDMNFLSIEMKYYYDTIMYKTQSKQMIAVANIFGADEEKSADSLTNILLTKFPEAKYYKTKIYMGCIH